MGYVSPFLFFVFFLLFMFACLFVQLCEMLGVCSRGDPASGFPVAGGVLITSG